MEPLRRLVAVCSSGKLSILWNAVTSLGENKVI